MNAFSSTRIHSQLSFPLHPSFLLSPVYAAFQVDQSLTAPPTLILSSFFVIYLVPQSGGHLVLRPPQLEVHDLNLAHRSISFPSPNYYYF